MLAHENSSVTICRNADSSHAPHKGMDQKRWRVNANESSRSMFQIRVANDRSSREKAYGMAAQLYRQNGYMPSECNAMLFSSYDEHPDTLTLLAEDMGGQPIGTITLIFDSERGLPSDAIFLSEINQLRASQRRVVEVTRLAIAPAYQRSKMLLVSMFNFIYIYATRVRKFNDFIVEVNPRHADFYTRLLTFQQAGPVRLCPRVQGAPAALLRLDLSVPTREVAAWADPEDQPDRKLLFSKFLALEKEPGVAAFLKQQHRPMDSDEASYFKCMNGVSSKSDTAEKESL